MKFNTYSERAGTPERQASPSSAVAQLSNNTLTCKVMGPTSPKMRLTLLKPGSEEATVSRKEKEVQVMAPDAGTWQCLLKEGEEVKIDSRIQGKDPVCKASR